MKQIGLQDGKEIWLLTLKRPYNFTAHFSGEPYVCILVVNESSISAAEQSLLSTQIVQSNCKYAVCAGHQCATWDLSIDIAYLETDPDLSPPEDEFVMTTWHEGEPLEEVLWFGFNLTNFDDHDFKKYLILLIGANESLENEVEILAFEEADLIS